MFKRLIIAVIIFLPLTIYPQIVSGRFSSSFYGFQRYDTSSTATTYIRFFDNLSLNVAKDDFSFKTRISFETDLLNSLSNDPRVRFYNMFFEMKNIADVATIRLGRQNFLNSIAGGLYDGAKLKFAYKKFALSGFYGMDVPAYQKFEFDDSWGDDYMFGGRFVVDAIQNSNLELAYVNKNSKASEYSTERLDENHNPITLLIKKNSNQFEYFSGKASYYLENIFRINSRVDYDLNFEKISKLEASGRYEQIKNIGINLYYNFREPRINYNSIFSVFNYGNTHEIECGTDVKLSSLFTIVAKFGIVTYNDKKSNRLGVGITSNYGTLHYRKTFGYSGELGALSLNAAYSFLEGLLTPSIGISFINYKTDETDTENNITAIMGGLNIRPWKLWSFDVQGQYFENKIYQDDLRILVSFNHWFSSNLGLL